MKLFDTACGDTDINLYISKEKEGNKSFDPVNDTTNSQHISDVIIYKILGTFLIV